MFLVTYLIRFFFVKNRKTKGRVLGAKNSPISDCNQKIGKLDQILTADFLLF